MADLYTSLIRAKQELNDGVLPPMTPIPKNVHHFIDPTFTPGLGGLEEDPEKGLRCPVVNCGKYYQSLKPHIDKSHGDIGGAARVMRALSIPANVPMVSRTLATKQKANGVWLVANRKTNKAPPAHDVQARARATRRNTRSANYRNLRNTCEAQIAHRMWDLYHAIGRSPTVREARVITGDNSLWTSCIRLYGSWNSAKATVGLDLSINGGRRKRQAVIEGLRAWHDAHGRLPTAAEAQNPGRVPLIPHYDTIARAFGMHRKRGSPVVWKTVMRRAAINLNVYDKRYRPPPGFVSTSRAGSTAQYETKEVLALYGAFYRAHGRLPMAPECQRRPPTDPYIPAYSTTLRHMGAASWGQAMREVATRLNVYDVRYHPMPAAA